MKKYLIYKLSNYLYDRIRRRGSDLVILGNLTVSVISSDSEERDIVLFTIEKKINNK